MIILSSNKNTLEITEIMDMQSEFDRILFFEHARKTAEATYVKDPLDAEVHFFFIVVIACYYWMYFFFIFDVNLFISDKWRNKGSANGYFVTSNNLSLMNYSLAIIVWFCNCWFLVRHEIYVFIFF